MKWLRMFMKLTMIKNGRLKLWESERGKQKLKENEEQSIYFISYFAKREQEVVYRQQRT